VNDENSFSVPVA